MSDFIKSIGAPGAKPLRSQQVAPKAPVQAGGESQTGTTAPPAATEGFQPSSEARETSQETKAGEATASKILGAWEMPTATAQGGQIAVQGLESTSVNQVHSTNNGLHTSSQAPQAGFSNGTVYTTRPPTA